MKRFKNILVVYDLVPGCDETLQRAVDLAKRNDAYLTVINAIFSSDKPLSILAERERLLTRILASIPLPKAKKSYLVRHGPQAEQILEDARTIQADLIVAPDVSQWFYLQLFGFDTSTELLRRADCPVWIVRPQKANNYSRIVAAVNAGKTGALDCLSNRRILEIGASLAALEQADLHVVFAWDYIGTERDMMASELPHGKYSEYTERARLKHLDDVTTLIGHVLGSSHGCTAVTAHGPPGKVIINYVEEKGADLLVIDGKIGGLISTALTNSTATQLLRQSSCSVLFAMPGPDARSAHRYEAA